VPQCGNRAAAELSLQLVSNLLWAAYIAIASLIVQARAATDG
jgi:hypothetical protein